MCETVIQEQLKQRQKSIFLPYSEILKIWGGSSSVCVSVCAYVFVCKGDKSQILLEPVDQHHNVISEAFNLYLDPNEI